MATWYNASGWGKSNDKWYTKLMKGLNWAFNPNHEWFDYDSWNENSTVGKISNFLNNAVDAAGTAVTQLADPEQLTSWVNSQTGAHLTGSQKEANEMAMQNQEDIYQRQVTGMQNAGLNPALMYQSGASSAPSPVQGNTAISNMSDMMQALLLEKQSNLLQAQTDNTVADTDKKKAETENMNLINKYYPDLTDSQIKKIMSDIGINDERIREIQSQVNLNELEAQLKAIETRIRAAEANESSAYYKATRELQEAKTEEARNSAREKLADALMKEIEGEYERNTNTKMSSSSLLAIASALGTIFSNSDHFNNWFRRNIYDKDKEYGWIIEKLQEWSDSRFAKKAEIAGASRYGGSRD